MNEPNETPDDERGAPWRDEARTDENITNARLASAGTSSATFGDAIAPPVHRYDTPGAGYDEATYDADDDPTKVLLCDASVADEDGNFPPCAE